MLDIIVTFSITLLISVPFVFFIVNRIKKKARKEIEQARQELAQEASEAYQKQVAEAERIVAEAKKATEGSKELYASLLKNIDRELEFYAETKKQEIISQQEAALVEVENYRATLLEGLFNEREEIESFLAPLKEQLEEHKRKVEAHNQALSLQHLKDLEKDFYRIVLKEDDKNDISYLLSIEKQIKNKEVLRKLIFDTYLRAPMNLMFKRVLNNEDFSGIYKITDSNGKSYIGKSTKIKTRWSSHIKESLGIGGISHQEIHNSLRSRGWDDFTFEILEKCDKELLNEREKYYIEFYETHTNGYNMKL